METFSALLAICAGNSPVTSDAELLCFLWSVSEPTVEQTMETPVIWDAMALIMTPLQCSGDSYTGETASLYEDVHRKPSGMKLGHIPQQILTLFSEPQIIPR